MTERDLVDASLSRLSKTGIPDVIEVHDMNGFMTGRTWHSVELGRNGESSSRR